MEFSESLLNKSDFSNLSLAPSRFSRYSEAFASE